MGDEWVEELPTDGLHTLGDEWVEELGTEGLNTLCGELNKTGLADRWTFIESNSLSSCGAETGYVHRFFMKGVGMDSFSRWVSPTEPLSKLNNSQ